MSLYVQVYACACQGHRCYNFKYILQVLACILLMNPYTIAGCEKDEVIPSDVVLNMTSG